MMNQSIMLYLASHLVCLYLCKEIHSFDIVRLPDMIIKKMVKI